MAADHLYIWPSIGRFYFYLMHWPRPLFDGRAALVIINNRLINKQHKAQGLIYSASTQSNNARALMFIALAPCHQ